MIHHARVVLENNSEGRLVLDITDENLYFHVKLHCWSIKKFKEYRAKFDGYLSMFKEVGYSVARATPYADDKRAKKLIAMFGFFPKYERNGFLLMERNL